MELHVKRVVLEGRALAGHTRLGAAASFRGDAVSGDSYAVRCDTVYLDEVYKT